MIDAFKALPSQPEIYLDVYKRQVNPQLAVEIVFQELKRVEA